MQNLEGFDIFSKAYNVVDGQNVSANRFVRYVAGKVRHAAAGATAWGVSMEGFTQPSSATVPYPWGNRQGINVRHMGIALVTAGANITDGTRVISDANGKAIPAVDQATDPYIGTALSNASTGEYVLVFLGK